MANAGYEAQKFVGRKNLMQLIKFVKDALSKKVDVVEGKGLSQNDYTDADKEIVDSIEAKISTAVTKAVTDALAEIEGVSSYQVVSELPQTGVSGTIYLTSNEGDDPDNQFDEYIWTGSEYEKLGGEAPKVLTDDEMDSLWRNSGAISS